MTWSDDDGYVDAHTDYRFVALSGKDPRCPYCGSKMNCIPRRVWQGSISKLFHAQVELVCANDKCPFPDLESWDDWPVKGSPIKFTNNEKGDE